YINCFFFQAEDGIRDKLVTGVQTCALPISHASPDTVRNCIEYFGVNRPVWDQYTGYLSNLFQGNWGKDPQGGQPVLPIILTLFPATIELLLAALFLMVVLGIPLGVIAANAG